MLAEKRARGSSAPLPLPRRSSKVLKLLVSFCIFYGLELLTEVFSEVSPSRRISS